MFRTNENENSASRSVLEREIHAANFMPQSPLLAKKKGFTSMTSFFILRNKKKTGGRVKKGKKKNTLYPKEGKNKVRVEIYETDKTIEK
jgi:hypothetical protein